MENSEVLVNLALTVNYKVTTLHLWPRTVRNLFHRWDLDKTLSVAIC